MTLEALKSIDNSRAATSARDGGIDNIRGLAMAAYLFSAIALYFYQLMPVWVLHGARENGVPFFNLGLFDFGPVMFYFIIGLTVVPAYRKSVSRAGKRKTIEKYLYRNLAIVGLAAAGIFFTNLHVWREDWSPLASIGITGILLIPFLGMDTNKRLFAGVYILLAYQLFRTELFKLLGGAEYTHGDAASFGGIASCVGYLGITLLTTVLTDLRKKNVWSYIAGVGALAVWAVFSQLKVSGAVYEEYNLSYLLVTLAAFAVFFLILSALNQLAGNRTIPVLSAVGRNLIFFLFLSIALGILCGEIFTVSKTNFWIALAASYLIFFGAALFLEKRKISIKI